VLYRSAMTRFEVEDTGIGFSEEDRRRIFLPFERGGNAVRHAGSSAGLGLTIAGMLATLMGGELSALHRPDGGSLLRLRLYLPEVRVPETVRVNAPIDIAGYEGPRRRILLVDDEWVDRELMRSVLEPLGFDLERAGSGIEALRMASSLRPDLVLLDLDMPDLNGWETARLLRVNRVSEAPILIISAGVQEKGRANDAGICPRDFIAKPVEVDALLALIADKLQLDWTLRDTTVDAAGAETPEPQSAVPEQAVLPGDAIRDRLHGLGVIGDVQAIRDALREVEETHPELAVFVDRLRTYIENFRLEEYLHTLERAGENDAATA